MHEGKGWRKEFKEMFWKIKRDNSEWVTELIVVDIELQDATVSICKDYTK